MRKLFLIGASCLMTGYVFAATFEDISSQAEHKTGLKELVDEVNLNFSQIETNISAFITDMSLSANDIAVPNTYLIIGDAGGTGQTKAVSGDIAITAAGAVTIQDISVADNDIAIANTKILVGNAGGTGAAVNVSGDLAMDNAGALTVTNANLAKLRLNNGTSLTNIPATAIEAAGVFKAVDGSALTNLNATELKSGTVDNTRLDADLQALALNNGASLTNMNATELKAGTMPIARIAAGAITGDKLAADIVTNVLVAGQVMPAVDISAATNANATELKSGTVPNGRLDSDLQTLALADGSGLTNIPDAALNGTVMSKLILNDGSTLTNMGAATAFSGYGICIVTNLNFDGRTNIITFIGTVSYP